MFYIVLIIATISMGNSEYVSERTIIGKAYSKQECNEYIKLVTKNMTREYNHIEISFHRKCIPFTEITDIKHVDE